MELEEALDYSQLALFLEDLAARVRANPPRTASVDMGNRSAEVPTGGETVRVEIVWPGPAPVQHTFRTLTPGDRFRVRNDPVWGDHVWTVRESRPDESRRRIEGTWRIVAWRRDEDGVGLWPRDRDVIAGREVELVEGAYATRPTAVNSESDGY